jgi:hypothetical protein
MIDPTSPAVREAVQGFRDAMLREDLTNREVLEVIAVMLADLCHYTSQAKPPDERDPSEQLHYALSELRKRTPALLQDAPYTK